MARTEDFNSGFDSVRSPQFESIQQQANRNFVNTSVLDNIMPNPNGMGSADFQRVLVGRKQSTIGTADSTFDRSLWITHQEPRNRADRLKKEE